MVKKLPVGVEFFEDFFTGNYYYVDKTMFIAELLQNMGKVNLFTRPRRFGKTLTMDMLKCFFEIGTDGKLFDGLKISQETELCEEYMGQFPVISITLKSVDGRDFQSAVAALKVVIGNECLRFQLLGKSDRLSEIEKNRYQALVNVGADGDFTMKESALLSSLQTLSQLLSKHYGKKVILLIDEYDVPLDKAFQGGYYDEMVTLIRNLFGNALKTNPDLEFAVITGCLRISKESIFTGLNNLNVMTITDEYFNDSFGFTEDEVRELLEYYGREEAIDTMRDWYDGYRFGGASIYCPWDVIKYTQALRRNRKAFPGNYWANTSGNDMVRRFIDKADQTTRDEIEQLIAGESIRKAVSQELTYRDLDSSIENLWSVLLMTGYLTATERISAKEYMLSIPNAEINDLFITQVKEWFKDTSRADLSRIEKFCAAFPGGDVKLIGDMLHDYLWDSISVRDTAVRKDMKENFYHGMVLGLLQSRSDWLIRSNAELGNGYSDIMICTPDRIGIVIELKYADDGNLEKGCAEALEQIDDRKYAVGLGQRRMDKIIKYGMAFCGKECMVVMAK
ncbi:MAG: AAA family ATPase [Eubacteriales bacterium]|nr:AAA family ATPase [Eubacteriales bacterium]